MVHCEPVFTGLHRKVIEKCRYHRKNYGNFLNNPMVHCEPVFTGLHRKVMEKSRYGKTP